MRNLLTAFRLTLMALLVCAPFAACTPESTAEDPADVPSVLTLRYPSGEGYDLILNGMVCPRDGVLSWSTAEATTYTVECSGAPSGKAFLKFVTVVHEQTNLSGEIYGNPVKVFIDHNDIILYPVFTP